MTDTTGAPEVAGRVPDPAEVATVETERVGGLVAHVLAHHAGDGGDQETTLALLLEHLHWQRQAGIRDGASFVAKLATAASGDRHRTLDIAAKALTEWADSNDRGRRPFAG